MTTESTPLVSRIDDSEPRLQARIDGERTWYGWQILAADGSAISTAAVLLHFGSGVAVIPMATLLFNGMFVHLAHDNGGRALVSFLLRIGAPVIGLVAGISSHAWLGERWGNSVTRAAVGFSAGAGAALVIDSAGLGWTGPAPSTEPEEPARSSVTAAAWTSPRGTTQYGLVGTF